MSTPNDTTRDVSVQIRFIFVNGLFGCVINREQWISIKDRSSAKTSGLYYICKHSRDPSWKRGIRLSGPALDKPKKDEVQAKTGDFGDNASGLQWNGGSVWKGASAALG